MADILFAREEGVVDYKSRLHLEGVARISNHTAQFVIEALRAAKLSRYHSSQNWMAAPTTR
jgi:hypothetical protein